MVVIDSIAARLTPDLEIYTVVRMAKVDIQNGEFDSAVLRLRVDLDKIQMHDPFLAEMIRSYKLTN